jgi:soluble lytic murein transglycosylase
MPIRTQSPGRVRAGESVVERNRARGRARGAVLSAAGLFGLAAGAAAAATSPPLKNVPLPRPRPHIAVARQTVPPPPKAAPAATATAFAPSIIIAPAPPAAEYHTASLTSSTPLPREEVAYAPKISTSESDLASVRQAIELARHGKSKDATDIEHRIEDPLARKLVEWAILRSDDNDGDSSRYHAFILANPSWPSLNMFRRKAEAMLWQEHADLATVRALAGERPLSVKGRFALGRALLAQGDQAGAAAAIRDPWRNESLSRDLEEQVLATFGVLISRADDSARMDRRLYAHERDGALRAAQRLGGGETAIAKAVIAVNEKSANAKALLEALPSSAQRQPIVVFTRIQLLRREDKIAEAAELMLAAPRDPGQILDVDEWWVERRLLARKLLDIGDAARAYQVARDAAPPAKENHRVEHEFTAGWIALRFLNEPAVAAQHFARIGAGITNPVALARASYWRGRAAEALNRPQEARSHFEQAARYGTAYYGQLARARLGATDIALAPPPVSATERAALSRIEVVRAAEILYAVGERDLVVPIVADLGDKAQDVATLAGLGEVATHHDDARSALLIGKGALGRGYAFEHYAFPTFGLPHYSPIGPEVETAVVYAIARQESEFNPRDWSTANAIGLMQVTPEAGRYVAKKFNIAYDQKRLINDTVYNTQLGAAELGDDIAAYRGSYILAFAGYNAGRGRVHEWVQRYGDPRDPDVDPIDWVERIPFSETRNYVERILENVQVYRARFGGGTRLLIEADIHRGAATN